MLSEPDDSDAWILPDKNEDELDARIFLVQPLPTVVPSDDAPPVPSAPLKRLLSTPLPRQRVVNDPSRGLYGITDFHALRNPSAPERPVSSIIPSLLFRSLQGLEAAS